MSVNVIVFLVILSWFAVGLISGICFELALCKLEKKKFIFTYEHLALSMCFGYVVLFLGAIHLYEKIKDESIFSIDFSKKNESK